MTKNCALSLDRSKRERENFWKSLNSDRTREKLMILKTLWTIFDWSKIRFDRSKFTFDWTSNDREAIEPGKFKPKI